MLFTRAILGWCLLIPVAVCGQSPFGPAELLTAPDDAPMYQLSPPRVTDTGVGGFKKVIVIDFKRTREGKSNGWVMLAGRTASGPFKLREFGGARFNQDSGTVLIDGGFGISGLVNEDFEMWLEMPTHLGKGNQAFMVSNAVLKGNLNSNTTARAWTAEERTAYEENKKSQIPPAALPPDHVAVDAQTKLLPGMPVMAGWKGVWEPAEVVRFAPGQGTVLVKYEKYPDPLIDRPMQAWVAVAPATLAKGQSNPDAFTSSVRMLAGGKLAIPDGYVAVDDKTPLVVGAPVQHEYHIRWSDAYVLELNGDRVRIGYTHHPNVWDKDVNRTELIIGSGVLADLDKPDAVKRFVADMQADRDRFAHFNARRSTKSEDGFPVARESSRRLQDYPIDIDIPKGAQVVAEDLPLEAGTPLAACWGRKWRAIKVLGVNQDGTVQVRWEEYGSAWDGDMARDQLIVQDKTVRKLKQKFKASPPASTVAAADSPVEDSPGDGKLRTWVDSTGNFKIQAQFVAKTETGVKLRRADGREITMPLEKLSLDDQNHVAELTAGVKNPFDQ